MLEAKAMKELSVLLAYIMPNTLACMVRKPIKYLNPVLSSKAEQQR